VLLRARLFPDMHPFTRQVQNATDLARRSPERLVGREPSSAEDPAPSFDALSARVKQTREHVQGFDRAAFEGAESRAITLNIGQTLELTGTSYALSFTLPNFLFHVTTAYDILRHNGVALGKRDYLGPFLAG
jgi:hypothetical protein